MQTTGENQALIIGAGIGGLAAAIALRRAGYAVQVFEHAQELREIGAGLTLWPNAVNALRKLGLATIIDAHSIPAQAGGHFYLAGEDPGADDHERGGTPGWRTDGRAPPGRTPSGLAPRTGRTGARGAGGAIRCPPGAV